MQNVYCVEVGGYGTVGQIDYEDCQQQGSSCNDGNQEIISNLIICNRNLEVTSKNR
jgi:hypothetical protein